MYLLNYPFLKLLLLLSTSDVLVSLVESTSQSSCHACRFAQCHDTLPCHVRASFRLPPRDRTAKRLPDASCLCSTCELCPMPFFKSAPVQQLLRTFRQMAHTEVVTKRWNAPSYLTRQLSQLNPTPFAEAARETTSSFPSQLGRVASPSSCTSHHACGYCMLGIVLQQTSLC